MRKNSFLQHELEQLLANEFADMPQPNRIEISFGRKAKRRFGSIRMGRDKSVSRITINGVFRDPALVPEEIIRATIAHELCHYAHGFCSPLPQKYEKPHQGSVVQRELKKRGLHHLNEYEKIWSKNNWPKIALQEFPRTTRSLRTARRVGALRTSRTTRSQNLRRARLRPSALKMLADFFKP